MFSFYLNFIRGVPRGDLFGVWLKCVTVNYRSNSTNRRSFEGWKYKGHICNKSSSEALEIGNCGNLVLLLSYCGIKGCGTFSEHHRVWSKTLSTSLQAKIPHIEFYYDVHIVLLYNAKGKR